MLGNSRNHLQNLGTLHSKELKRLMQLEKITTMRRMQMDMVMRKIKKKEMMMKVRETMIMVKRNEGDEFVTWNKQVPSCAYRMHIFYFQLWANIYISIQIFE